LESTNSKEQKLQKKLAALEIFVTACPTKKIKQGNKPCTRWRNTAFTSGVSSWQPTNPAGGYFYLYFYL